MDVVLMVLFGVLFGVWKGLGPVGRCSAKVRPRTLNLGVLKAKIKFKITGFGPESAQNLRSP